MAIHLRAALVGATAIMLAAAPAAFAKTVNFSGNFVTENGATTQPMGSVNGTLDTGTDKITYVITYSGLSGDVVAAHFHGPATTGQNAGVLLPIPGPFETGMQGVLTANSTTVKALLAGKTYVNLHTAKYQDGEARAQISVTK